jgi:diguanylate cyclase (GGDEF)-like protein
MVPISRYAFLRGASTVVYPANSLILEEGKDLPSLLFIRQGLVRMTKEFFGHVVELGVRERGQFLGEAAWIDGDTVSATCTAITDCELYRIERAAFEKWLSSGSENALRMVKFMTERVRQVETNLVEQISLVGFEKARSDFKAIKRLGKTRKLLNKNLELHDLATKDALTGCLNRRALESTLASWVEQSEPFAIFMFDLDHFKQYNDTYGHAFGDEALKTVCYALARRLRENDALARYGGEEFVLLVRGAPLSKIAVIVERFRQAVADAPIQGRTITLSGGVSLYPQEGNTAPALLEKADQRLYLAKKQGRNQVVTPDLVMSDDKTVQNVI